RHLHTEDEIIVIHKGAMAIGRRSLGPGTALAIDANTVYSFGVPQEGLEFLNFRTSEPFYVKVGPKNEPLHAPIPELALARDEKLHHFGTDEPATAQEYEAAGLRL